MSAPTTFSERRLLAGLEAFAEEESAGRQLTNIQLAAAVGSFGGSDARLYREALVAKGWLIVLAAGGAARLAQTRVTAEGWAVLGQTPPTPNPRGPRRRDCLKCHEPFDSEGAHNRMCGLCRSNPDRDIAF